MSEHRVQISWKRTSTDFNYDTYDRTHEVRFEGGQKIQSSAAVDFNGKAEYTNPEEMLAAAASTCHMLTFLAICAKKKMIVNSYTDHAVATLGKRDDGKMAVRKIRLQPKVIFESDTPDTETLRKLHDKSHENCFIANSLSCDVEVAK